MKRFIAIAVLLVLLAGCAAPAAPAAPTTPAVLPPVTGIDPHRPPSLMDGRTELASGLYRLSSATVDSLLWASSLHLYGDCLLIGSSTASHSPGDFSTGLGYQLQLLDRKTGELKARVLLDGMATPSVQVCGDRIAVIDANAKTLRLFNERLLETDSMTIPALAYPSYLNANATGLYYFRDGRLEVLNLKTNKATQLLPQASNIYPGSRIGDSLTFSYIPAGESVSRFSCLNLATGRIQEPPYQTSYANAICNGELWLSLISFSDAVYYVGNRKNGGFLQMGDRYGTLIDGPAPLLLTSYGSGKTTMALYGENGESFGSCTLSGRDASVTDPLWSEEEQGYFMLSLSGSGSPSLLFWTPREKGEDLELLPRASVSPAPGRKAAQELYDRAAALSEQYGLTVCIAEDCPEEHVSFTADRMEDYWLISNGLDQLEKALSAYPAGFFEQLRYGPYTDTRISLTGTIHPKYMPEDTAFSAYVEQQAPEHRMALDVTQYGLEQNIYHEFSHIIDQKLQYEAEQGRTDYSEEGWAALNPEDFIYIWTVYEVPDSYRNDGYDSYFIDTYSRTFPTEDRARVLEYAMSDQAWMFEETTHGPLRQKLRYYSTCIREAFDTAGWPEVTRWEEPLQGNPAQP